MKSNYSFLENIDSELFLKILKVEKRAKTNPYEIGNSLRHVLEYLCNKKIVRYNLKDEMLAVCAPNIPSLFDQMRLLRDNKDFLPRVRSISGNEDIKPLPCFNVRLTYKDKSGNILSRFDKPDAISEKDRAKYSWADNFLRQICNDYSHEDNIFLEKVFAKRYENVIYALRVLQDYIIKYYDLDRNKIPFFNEDWMPISDYEITGVKIPLDKDRTSCEKEYTAKRYEDYRDDTVGYSVIRQYPRLNSRANFLRRAPDVYLAKDNMRSLLKKVTIISEGGNNDRPFYLVAYDFSNEAYKLNTKLLSSLDFSEKVNLCLSYAKNMADFHKNSTPIYHRVFSSDCAYYSDERNGGGKISTAIIKFEYAKIDDDKTLTVIGTKPKNMFSEKEDLRYIAPEWSSLTDPTATDWARVDVYSLGILFCDIMMGSIGEYQMNKLGQMPDIKPMMPLLSSMCGIAKGRPDIDYVCSFLEEMINDEN